MAEQCSKGIMEKVQVTCSSSECLQLINDALLQLFNFNHDQTILDCKKALTIDKDCIMAHYLIAYSNAGHYNNPDGMDYREGYEEAEIASSLAKRITLTDWEKGLIEAQVLRFCSPVGSVPLGTLNKNYANAMRSVYSKFGENNVVVAALFAESLMNLAPWKLWTPYPEYKEGIPETGELVKVLENALKQSPQHPGLCHFYIHTMELSATPEKALPCADALRETIKDHGHLLHMASHIDMWVGHYKEATEVNELAILADKRYMLTSKVENNFYKMYRMHNFHFVIWAAMFNGQLGKSLEFAEELQEYSNLEGVTAMLGDMPLGLIFLEPTRVIIWEVLIRFGKWEDILKRPIEQNKELYPSNIAMARYARGVAYAALGKVAEAEVERDLFYESLKDKTLAKRRILNSYMYNPETPGKCILDVADSVLNGEIEYRKGNYQQAFDHLRLAVKRDTSLVYGEPWSWMIPSRHVLGALLLEHGDVQEAEAVYREDLIQYKDNMWSLLGLHQSLKAQNKLDEAQSVYEKYQKASVLADIKVGASCLCATKMCS
ncbi:hypothetical protein LOD99_6701 [Oopsacas minuta]|uniref:Tetratricopeptide repeat protein 38 n=1 Tax=Oopsacas minuta TaxID=111878 RepID=A0AAV7JMC2_9METZ|nr:hypothetical protein LOD99_6701 [Oopsacas minuta]